MAGRASLQLLISSTASLAPISPQRVVQRSRTLPNNDVIFTVNETLYLATAPHANSSIPVNVKATEDILVTVIDTDSCSIDANLLHTTIQDYFSYDDVHCSAFLSSLILTSGCSENLTVHEDVPEYLATIDSTLLTILDSTNDSARLRPGPYLGHKTSEKRLALSEVYILYQDRYRDFVYGVYPSSSEDTYQPLPNFNPYSTDLFIPVPSRLYSLKDPRPLAGLRIGVKDLYDLSGTKTSAGSRAWTEIHTEAGHTAPSIQRLVDLGGIIVGKQKLAQFASGADPWDWTDIQYPFNPRGDGYLTCAASSSGGGCSVGAYDWLDIAIGSDTGSSMRLPASVSGTFGNRPSQGIMSLEGVVPLGAAMDTAGLFARDPTLWSRVAKEWYTPSLYQAPSVHGLEALAISNNDDLPRSIKFDPAYLPARNPSARKLVQNFLANITSLLNITMENANITSLLLSSTIPAVNNMTVRTHCTSTLISYTHWNEVSQPLLSAWTNIDMTRLPPVDPFWRASLVDRSPANISRSQYDDALLIRRNFSEWVNHHFLGNGNPTMGACADSSIWIYDIGTGGLPSYRENELLVDYPENSTRLQYTPPATIMPGMVLCSIGGCADYTIPIGQVEYFSEVSRVNEMLPVTVSIVAKRGCDFMLFNIVDSLTKSGVLQTVKTGRTAF